MLHPHGSFFNPPGQAYCLNAGTFPGLLKVGFDTGMAELSTLANCFINCLLCLPQPYLFFPRY